MACGVGHGFAGATAAAVQSAEEAVAESCCAAARRPATACEHAAMNTYLAAASLLAFFVGTAHSVMGEAMIFSRMRQRRLAPTQGSPMLGRAHVRILWASWHVATVFGWLAAAKLMFLAARPVPPDLRQVLLLAIGVAMFVASLLVLFGTRGRHPGWVAMLLVATLILLGNVTQG